MRARSTPKSKGFPAGFRGLFRGSDSASMEAQEAISKDAGHPGQARLG